MTAIDLGAKGAFELLVERVRAGEESTRPRVVALDGRSGVGKSTLAARLAEVTGATVIDGDGFYTGGVEVRRDPPEQRVADCIDWRRQRKVLTGLREGDDVNYVAFDWEAFHDRPEGLATTIEWFRHEHEVKPALTSASMEAGRK